MIPPSRLSVPLNECDIPEMSKPEAKSRTKVDGRRVDPQKMNKFKHSIRAFDKHAEFYVDGNPLKVTHSRCGGQSTQEAIGDTQNFKEHIGICKGPRASDDDNSSLKSSLQRGLTSSTHPTMTALSGPDHLPCPGYNFEDLFGKDFESLPNPEREQVDRAMRRIGLSWVDGKRSVISKSCSKERPSCQERAKPCPNCSKALDLSGFRYVLCHESPRSNSQRFSPWKQLGLRVTDPDH